MQFTSAVSAAVRDGYRNFVEISPRPVVSRSLEETLSSWPAAECVVRAVFEGSDRDTEAQLCRALGCAEPKVGRVVGEERALDVEIAQRTFYTAVNRPYPGSHRMFGKELLTASKICDLMLSVGFAGLAREQRLHDVEFQSPVFVEGGATEVLVERRSGGHVTVTSGGKASASGWLPVGSASGELSDWSVSQDSLKRISVALVEEALSAIGSSGRGYPWEMVDVWVNGNEGRVRVALERVQAPFRMVASMEAALTACVSLLIGNVSRVMAKAIRSIAVRPGSIGSSVDVLIRRDGEWFDVDVREIETGALVIRISGYHLVSLEGLSDVRPTKVGSMPAPTGNEYDWLNVVQQVVSTVSGWDSGSLDLDVPLADLGFDSIMSAHLRRELSKLGTVDDGLFWTRPSVRELAISMSAQAS